MKKLLPLFFLALSFGLHAQYYPIYNAVWDSNHQGIPHYKVWTQVYVNGSATLTKSGYTDSSSFGGYLDSIPSAMVFDSIVNFTYDCNGNTVYSLTGSEPYNPSQWGYYEYSDTLFPACNNPDPTTYADFTYKQSSTTPLTIDFLDNSHTTGIKAARGELIMYFFGDNDSTWGVKNTSHTYAQAGTYVVTYVYHERDTVHGINFKSISYTDTVHVSATMPPADCEAAYVIDTNSTNNTAVIYNTSKPSIHDSTYIVTYFWDFGDGHTSNLALPTHLYDTAGIYQVCLTVTTMDSLGFSCSSTFCDSLGFDTNGNFLYKQAGFTLQVLDGSLSENEFESATAYNIYPNPVSDVLYFESENTSEKNIDYTLLDLKGSILMKGTFNKMKKSIDISHLNAGMYILHLQNNNVNEKVKIIKE